MAGPIASYLRPVSGKSTVGLAGRLDGAECVAIFRPRTEGDARMTMMDHSRNFIDGAWVESDGDTRHAVINPATEAPCTVITLSTAADVDRAVAAARRAFEGFSRTSREARLALLDRIIAEYRARMPDIAQAISTEMGAPIDFANGAQAPTGLGHLTAARTVLEDFAFEERMGKARVWQEPIGVVAMITPWNWPVNQIAVKVAYALAAGCTMVLKPSEESPACAAIFAEVLDAAGVPPGVFNLVQGDGPTVGAALAAHGDVDMVSFTGSTRAGIAVAKAAADSVKRVAQELGGKSPFIVLPGAPVEEAMRNVVGRILSNAGQSCIAPTRLLVHAPEHDAAAQSAAALMKAAQVGDPALPGRHIGPVVNRSQWEKIQGLIESGIREGARLVAGGPGRPDGLNRGFYVRPTLFADADNGMRIAREEIFGPVLTMIPYADPDDAVRIANDTPYGLAAYIAGPEDEAAALAPRLRAGTLFVNKGAMETLAPFGGYKRSGNGREFGRYGLEEFMERKSIAGL
jgi:aldehyde dehydrogenase (NAD+)